VRHMRGATAHNIESNNTDKLPWTAINPCKTKRSHAILNYDRREVKQNTRQVKHKTSNLNYTKRKYKHLH